MCYSLRIGLIGNPESGARVQSCVTTHEETTTTLQPNSIRANVGLVRDPAVTDNSSPWLVSLVTSHLTPWYPVWSSHCLLMVKARVFVSSDKKSCFSFSRQFWWVLQESLLAKTERCKSNAHLMHGVDWNQSSFVQILLCIQLLIKSKQFYSLYIADRQWRIKENLFVHKTFYLDRVLKLKINGM